MPGPQGRRHYDGNNDDDDDNNNNDMPGPQGRKHYDSKQVKLQMMVNSLIETMISIRNWMGPGRAPDEPGGAFTYRNDDFYKKMDGAGPSSRRARRSIYIKKR